MSEPKQVMAENEWIIKYLDDELTGLRIQVEVLEDSVNVLQLLVAKLLGGKVE